MQASWAFSSNISHEIFAFHMIRISWFQHECKIEIILKSSWNCDVRQNFITKTCLSNNYLSCDPHYVILAWVETWNIFEILMKVCSPPQFFHKNRSHEQLIFTWSTFHDSSIITKLKYFWKSHETAKFARIHSQNVSHEQLRFTWSAFRDSSMSAKLKYFWKAHETVTSARINSQMHVSRTITFHVIHISWF